jgi:DNA-binding XRE family transcriptional regulator
VNRQAFLAAFEAKGCNTGMARAQLLGVTRKSVDRYLAGEVAPLLPTARRIARRLDVGVDELWPAA